MDTVRESIRPLHSILALLFWIAVIVVGALVMLFVGATCTKHRQASQEREWAAAPTLTVAGKYQARGYDIYHFQNSDTVLIVKYAHIYLGTRVTSVRYLPGIYGPHSQRIRLSSNGQDLGPVFQNGDGLMLVDRRDLWPPADRAQPHAP